MSVRDAVDAAALVFWFLAFGALAAALFAGGGQ